MSDWAFRKGKAAGRFTDNLPGSEALHLPLATEGKTFGVLAVGLPDKRVTLAQRDLLETFVRQAALVLDRVELRNAAEQAHLLVAVLLDLGLPDLDGVEVLKRLREWSRVPVVILSVCDREDDKVAALDAGADDYVTKPFHSAECSPACAPPCVTHNRKGLTPFFPLETWKWICPSASSGSQEGK